MRTMSRRPTPADVVGLTRGTFEAANRSDFDHLMSFFGPDSVWDMAPWGLGTYEGPPAIRHFFTDWFGAYDKFEIVPEEIVDLGNGVVLAVGRQEGRSAGWRAAHIRLRHASVFAWVEGVAVSVATYRDIDDACAAAKLAVESSRGARAGENAERVVELPG
jgi:ketosteroid isomerase-like protein